MLRDTREVHPVGELPRPWTNGVVAGFPVGHSSAISSRRCDAHNGQGGNYLSPLP